MKGVKGIEYGKRIYPRVSDDVFIELQDLAYQNRTTMSEYVRDVLTKHVKEVTGKDITDVLTKHAVFRKDTTND